MEQKITLHSATLKQFSALGLDVVKLLLQAGIVAENPPLKLNPQQFSALISAIATQSDDPLIGLKLATADSVSQLDPTTFAAVHSVDFADCLERLARYKKLICPEDIHWRLEQDGIAISNRWTSGVAFSNLLVDGFFASIHTILQLAFGKAVAPLAVHLTRAEIPLGYADFFGCDIVLNAECNTIRYPSELLHQPFVTHNPDLLGLIVPNLETEISRNAVPNLAEQVKTALFAMMNGNKPTIDNVASQLHISRRTLQRKLAEHGLNYQNLLDEVRLTIAKQVLHQTDLENGEIAFYLGFAEVNSFHRFFVQQTGKTPNDWRAQAI